MNLPAEILDDRVAIVGTAGSGKTVTAKLGVERLLRHKARVCIVDPTGAWWGLRSSADGKGTGFPITIFGGEHGDLPLNARAGKLMGETIADGDFSCILDLTSLKTMKDRRAFMKDFAEALHDKNRDPLHLILDEADLWCLDEETELLTDDGWKRHDAIEPGMQAVCFDLGTETYSYGPVERVIRRQHDGEMIRLKTKGLDCLATPDHRVVLRRVQRGTGRYGLYPWTFCEARNVPTCVGVPIGGAPVGTGCDGLTPEMARILGWVITDGNIHSRKVENKVLTITQSHGTTKLGRPIAAEMASVLDAIPGVRRYERGERSHGALGREIKSGPSCSWYLGKDLSKKLLGWLGGDIHRIPRLILKDGNIEQLTALYKGLLEGDGAAQYGRHWTHFYPGLKRGLGDDFQELALRLGFSTSLSTVSKRTDVCVSIAGQRRAHWIRRQKREHYSGVVWDITVPTGAFVARRNGRIFVTGNCPQRPLEDIAALLGARIDEIVRRGRIRGFCPWLITQRPAVIHKDVLSQLDTLIAMKLTSSQDRDALMAWIEGNGDKSEEKRIRAVLPTFQKGQGLIWAPGHGLLIERQFDMPATFDSSKTPKRGEKIKGPKERAAVDLDALRAALAEVEKEAAENDPRALKAEIVRLKREIAEKPAAETVTVSTGLTNDDMDRAHALGELEGEAKGMKAALATMALAAPEITIAVCKILKDLDARARSAAPVMAGARAAFERAKAAAPIGSTSQRIPVRNAPPRMVAGPGSKLAKAERAILTALAQYPQGRTKTQIAILCGYASNSGSFSNSLGSNRTAGRLEGENTGIMRITETGLADLGTYDPLPHGRLLLEHWLGQLGKAEATCLRAITAAYPERQTKEEVADATGYAADSGSFSNALGKLRMLELIEGSNASMRASDALFC